MTVFAMSFDITRLFWRFIWQKFFTNFLCFINMVHNIICPCVKWISPRTWGFYSQIIYATNDSKESLFTPCRSPWISNNPNIRIWAPSNNWYIMIYCSWCCAINYSSCIICQRICINTTNNWAILIYLIHHLSYASRNLTIRINSINIICRNVKALSKCSACMAY